MSTVEWKGRVALITGASSGIGLDVARAMVARGARVALVARTKARLDAIARELGEERAAAFPCDVTNRKALLDLPRAVVARFGRLDFVVNNAGVNHRGAVHERSAEELAEILETNLVSPVMLTRAALDHIEADGAIVNVASLAGKVALAHEATYCASKSGLRAFSRALGIESARTGPRISVVCPGPVDTGFFGDVSKVPDMVFSQPMRSSKQVAQTVIEAIEGPALEVDIPKLSGYLATLGYLFPKVYTALRPVFERRGAAAKRKYVAERASAR